MKTHKRSTVVLALAAALALGSSSAWAQAGSSDNMNGGIRGDTGRQRNQAAPELTGDEGDIRGQMRQERGSTLGHDDPCTKGATTDASGKPCPQKGHVTGDSEVRGQMKDAHEDPCSKGAATDASGKPCPKGGHRSSGYDTGSGRGTSTGSTGGR
jgi:hypothetical protein